MNIIKIENNYSWLQTEDDKLRLQLWKALRWKEKNYFHNSRYRMKLWDGYKNFFDKDTGKFLTGLLPEVKRFIKEYSQEYQCVDNRDQLQFFVESVDENFIGSPKLRDYQVEYINLAIRNRRGIVFAPTSAGKALPLHSTIWTPQGPVKMGDIKVGDEVCVPSGGSAKVVGVYPQGVKKIVRIVFSNGDSVECCEDHLWKVNALYDQWSGKVLSTKKIRENLRCPNGASRFNITPPSRIDFVYEKVQMEPYLLGLFLGDGCTRCGSPRISTIEKEIIEYLNQVLPSNYSLKRSGTCDYRLVNRKGHVNEFTQKLKILGIWGKRSFEKSIPKSYLFNSYSVRLELLRGLMDTDGYVSKFGTLSYTTTSVLLSEDVKFLIQSLGGIARIKSLTKKYTYKGEVRHGRLAYVISFTLPEGVVPFNLTWKKERCKLVRTRAKNRVISDIVDVGEKECQCIMVDHPDHMYVTDHFVPTHNTNIMIGVLKALPPDTLTLVLANRTSLVDQNYDEIMRSGIPNVGRFYGGKKEVNKITCATVQSAHLLKPLLPKIRCLIVDEIHEMMSKKPRQIYSACKAASVRLGFSATPFKFGESDMCQKFEVKGFIGPVFQIKNTKTGKLTTAELQDRGILSTAECIFRPIRNPDLPYHTYIDAVTEGLAENTEFHQINKRLVDTIDGRILIIVERLEHGDRLLDLMPNAVWVRGQDNIETRKVVINRLKEEKGKVVAIATSGIFNTGLNVFIHHLINSAGGQAEHQIIQRFGRGLRKATDKDHVVYHDWFFHNNDYLKKHSKKRVAVLRKEGHIVKVLEELDI